MQISTRKRHQDHATKPKRARPKLGRSTVSFSHYARAYTSRTPSGVDVRTRAHVQAYDSHDADGPPLAHLNGEQVGNVAVFLRQQGVENVPISARVYHLAVMDY